MRKWPLAVLALVLVLGVTPPETAQAEDIAIKKVLRNAVHGGALGALIGTALLAFVDDPSDHLEYISIGAASGVLVGVGWGLYDSSSPYVYLDKGKVHAAMAPPRLSISPVSAVDRRQREALLSTRLVGVRF
ncbi:MAG: hypothetical protein ACE5FN_01270 [Leptospirillia bacterium]